MQKIAFSLDTQFKYGNDYNPFLFAEFQSNKNNVKETLSYVELDSAKTTLKVNSQTSLKTFTEPETMAYFAHLGPVDINDGSHCLQ